jgi:outer membrane protein OmpA-like peptidoglycan-associated protein
MHSSLSDSVRFRVGASSYELRETVALRQVTLDTVPTALVHRLLLAALSATGQGRMLAGFLQRRPGRRTMQSDPEQIAAAIAAEVRTGRMVIVRLPRPVIQQGRIRLPPCPCPWPRSVEATQPQPVPDDPRALRIVDCPPSFDPRHEYLPVTYLLRKLEGQAIEFVIRGNEAPEPAVHRRLLTVAETRSGSGKVTWDGIDQNTGALVSRDRSPFTVELFRDKTYRDTAPTSIPPPSLVHVVEMEDLVFATGRAILMPDGGIDEDAEGRDRITGLHAIATALRHAAFHSDSRLCVFGHADTVGDDADNLALSRERALNVLCMLEGDAEAWARHCNQHYQVADIQRVLTWIAAVKSWPTDPGPIDNEFGPATRVARANFRERMNREYFTTLEQGVKQGINDWIAYFTLFDEELARILGSSTDDLQRTRSKVRFTKPAALGCGEVFPAEQPGVNNLDSATNRRVDLVFFDPDEVPDLSAEPAGSPLYGTKDYIAKYLPIGEDGGSCPVILRLLGWDGWLGGVEYTIELDGQRLASGTTSTQGWVETELPRNATALVMHLPTLARSFTLDVAALCPASDIAGLQGRLINLGYLCPTSGTLDVETREALRAFQRDHALPPSGTTDGITIDTLCEIHD